MARIAKEICSGKFLHNVDTMSYVMGAPNADTFQVPILIAKYQIHSVLCFSEPTLLLRVLSTSAPIALEETHLSRPK